VTPDVVLTAAAERLMARYVDSVGALDLLLLLHAAPGRDWTLAELCAELRCPPTWAARELGRLAELDLVTQPEPGHHRFCAGGRPGAAVEELVRAYQQDRAAVVRWVFATPPHDTVTEGSTPAFDGEP
jgi:hypothetical protein